MQVYFEKTPQAAQNCRGGIQLGGARAALYASKPEISRDFESLKKNTKYRYNIEDLNKIFNDNFHQRRYSYRFFLY